MGKKRRLNRFISKWIKSDLPEDRTTVLLLGVTRIPTSPVPNRRPYSLPPSALGNGDFFDDEGAAKQNSRRGSISDGKKSVVVRKNSSLKKGVGGGRRLQVPAISVHHVDTAPQVSTFPSPSFGQGECFELGHPVSELPVTHQQRKGERPGGDVDTTTTAKRSATAPKCAVDDVITAPGDVMERSVDSIGTCSLDVDASVDFSDWSEPSSAGTLRSASIISPSPEPHLPSYLSLACTVNGYSTITHYDPVRLASRSRDASPHRIDSEQQHTKPTSYSIQNNLLSPPNIVPLPIQKMENTIAQHRSDFYSSMKTTTYLSKQSFTSGIFSSITKDSTDSCLENGHHSIQNKCVSFEHTTISSANGQNKCLSETTMKQEYSNGKEKKSFIQQRVERLYGPGALAQGFFISKSRHLSEADTKSSNETEKHSKSFNDALLKDDLEPSMKQSTSSPTLPVLRHLRPEFRAQLPVISPRKGLDAVMPKSITIPKLKVEVKVNGHSKVNEVDKVCEKINEINGSVANSIKTGTVEKDGHYFLKILEDQATRLLELAARVESDISTPNLSEEVIGKLRSASGKARLLVTQKMQQFKGLCTNNINRTAGEAFPTTNEDLQGFWDMVMLQVDQVDALFKEIEELKMNGWQEPIKLEPKTSTTSNGTAKTKKPLNRPRPNSAANEEARKQRETERKKMIEERRKAMKAAQQNKPTIEIFVPESSS